MVRKRADYMEPRVPTVPGLPSVPRRSNLRDKFAGFAPDIPVPQPDEAVDFERRRSAVTARHPAMSIPEFIVYDWLVTRKKWKEGVEFVYQLPLLGGRTIFGGFVVDFYIRPGNMAWNVQGLRYHLLQTRDRAKTMLQKALLSSRGYRVVHLWEDDLLERPDLVITEALRGQESSRHADDVGLFT